MAASVELDGMIFNNENAMGDERHESSQKQPVHEHNLDATLQEDDLALDKNIEPPAFVGVFGARENQRVAGNFG